MPIGGLSKAGELLPMPDVANTLKTLRDDDPQSFYEGAMATTMARHVQLKSGILSVEDLKQYRARIQTTATDQLSRLRYLYPSVE